MARVAISTFGSGGDLFPFIPVARRLRSEGHDVALILPRSLTLYTRLLGLAAVPTGDGREMRVYNDAELYTTRFFGWVSWRRVYDDYIAPSLGEDVARVRNFLTDWAPDVVVTSSFAVAARVAALSDGHRHVVCSIYPQHFALSGHDRSNVPRAFMRQLLNVAPAGALNGNRLLHLAWGCDGPGVLLHDQALLGRAVCGLSVTTTGFPYWDTAPTTPGELDLTLNWIEDSPEPVIVITMGSFVGLRPISAWSEATRAVTRAGARAVLIGAKSSRTDIGDQEPGRVLTTGFLPLSEVLPHSTAVVHHGGVGTTFAAAKAGKAAIVVPQAFDQSFSASLLEQAGIGVDASHMSLFDAVPLVLNSDGLRERARLFRDEMIDSTAATGMAADAMLGVARGDAE